MAKYKIAILSILILFITTNVSSQINVGIGNTPSVANAYYPVSGISGTSVTVGAGTGVAHTIGVGDRVLLAQMTGSTDVNGGKFEMAWVTGVSGSTITLDAVERTYSETTEAVQLVWVPYDATSINVVANILAEDWNGSTGGIVALQTPGTLNLNGSLLANGSGFCYDDGLNTISGSDIYYGGAGGNWGAHSAGGGGYGSPGLTPGTGTAEDGTYNGGNSSSRVEFGGFQGGAGGGGGVAGGGGGGGSLQAGGSGGGAGYSSGGCGSVGGSSQGMSFGGEGHVGGTGDTDGTMSPVGAIDNGPFGGGGGGGQFIGGGGGGWPVDGDPNANTVGLSGSNGGAGADRFGGVGGGIPGSTFHSFWNCDGSGDCSDPRIWMGGGGGGRNDICGGGIVFVQAGTIDANNQTFAANGDDGEQIDITIGGDGGSGGGGGGFIALNTQSITTGPLSLCVFGGEGGEGDQVDPNNPYVLGGGGIAAGSPGGAGGAGAVWVNDPQGGIGDNETGLPPAVANITFCGGSATGGAPNANPKHAEFTSGGGCGGSVANFVNPNARIFEACVLPTLTSSTSQGTCTGASANNDATISLSGITNGDEANIIAGATYTPGDDYGNANNIDVSAGSGSFTGLMHATQYTVRVWNGASDCYVDETIMTPSITCTPVGDCTCTDYLYLAEVTDGTIHKFELGSTLPLPEVGLPWYPSSGASEFPSPHGIAVDLNGFIYIGEVGALADPSYDGANIRKLNCDGTLLPESDFVIDDVGNNFQSIGNTLYVTGGGQNDIRAYDLCSGDLIGTACFDGLTRSWELDYNKVTDMFTWGGSAGIYAFSMAELNASIEGGGCIGPALIPAAPTGVNTLSSGDNYVFGAERVVTGVGCGVWGVTSDNDGNIYVMQSCTSSGNHTSVLKYDSNGEFVTQSPVGTLANGDGWHSGMGLRYHDETDMIYHSNWRGSADCVSAWNTDLDTYTQAVPPTGQPGTGAGKAINIITECCPNSDIDMTETICANIGETIYLQDILTCGEGTVCEGQWQVTTANANQVFDDCSLSITVDNGSGCGVYNLTKTGGITGAQQCGAFDIQLTICTEVPAVTVTSAQGTCNGAIPNNDATISLTGVTGDEANIMVGAIYTPGDDYGSASNIDVSGGSGSITGLTHNTMYTVRVWNGASDCFVDETITTPSITCEAPCPDPNCFNITPVSNN